MIHCVLLNPSIDHIFEIPHFKAGETFKTQKSLQFPVGKAISVALTLRAMDTEVNVVALIGKEDLKQYNDFLTMHKIVHTLFPVSGKTRSNITIVDSDTKLSTHLRSQGFSGDIQDFEKINSFLRIMVQKDDLVIFSGSLPSGAPKDYYLEPSEIVRNKRAKLIIDSSGERLKLLKMYNPYIIKANLKEMEMIVDRELCPTDEFDYMPNEEELYTLLDSCSELNNYKSKYNVLTLGKFGSLIFTRNEAYFAHIELDRAAYTIGCGDAFLGGLVYGLIHNYSIKENLEIATICGAANTLCLGPGIINREDFPNLKRKLKLQRLR